MLVTGVEGLYVWCRRITGGYRGVEVNNMTEAWRSGLAFCAIIHRFRPDTLDWSRVSAEEDPEHWRRYGMGLWEDDICGLNS